MKTVRQASQRQLLSPFDAGPDDDFYLDCSRLLSKAVGQRARNLLPKFRWASILIQGSVLTCSDFIDAVMLLNPIFKSSQSGGEFAAPPSHLSQKEHAAFLQLRKQFTDILLSGIATHFVLTDFPNRERLGKIEAASLKEKWYPSAAAVDELKQYDSDHSRLPSTIVQKIYDERFVPLLKETFGFDSSKDVEIRSFVQNIFFAGILLAMLADLETIMIQ
jgi:hypothetical protein